MKYRRQRGHRRMTPMGVGWRERVATLAADGAQDDFPDGALGLATAADGRRFRRSGASPASAKSFRGSPGCSSPWRVHGLVRVRRWRSPRSRSSAGAGTIGKLVFFTGLAVLVLLLLRATGSTSRRPCRRRREPGGARDDPRARAADRHPGPVSRRRPRHRDLDRARLRSRGGGAGLLEARKS